MRGVKLVIKSEVSDMSQHDEVIQLLLVTLPLSSPVLLESTTAGGRKYLWDLHVEGEN